MKVLLIRLSALGDILHGLPVLAALRRAMPEAHLGWLVEDAGAPLLEGHPMLDEAHVMPRRAWRAGRWQALRGPIGQLIRRLRARRYDVAVDLQGLTKSAVWARLSGAPRRIGFRGADARELSRVFYNLTVAPPPEAAHVIRRNLALLQPLGIASPAVELPIHLPSELRVRARELWPHEGPDGSPRVLMSPGAGWITKQWPAEAYGRLAARLVQRAGASIRLAWGPGEEPLAELALAAARLEGGGHEAESGAPGSAQPGVRVLPPTSFTEVVGLAAEAHLFIGGDTGPTHFAAALGVPTVALYGASDPARNGPWGPRVTILQAREPPCVPCWQTRCRWPEPLACMKSLSVDRVLEAALDRLGKGAPVAAHDPRAAHPLSE